MAVNMAALKVAGLGCLGIAIMMAVALSLAYTEGAQKPTSSVKYSTIATSDVEVTSSAEACSGTELGACPTVLVFGTAEDSLEVTVTKPAGSDATNATVQLCFEDSFLPGRPWRKPNDVIGKDKQCFKGCTANFDGDDASCIYSVNGNTGAAVYYLRALLFSEVQSDGVPVYTAGNTNDGVGNFQIDAYKGVTKGILGSMIGLSILSWAILIGGVVREKVKQS